MRFAKKTPHNINVDYYFLRDNGVERYTAEFMLALAYRGVDKKWLM